MRYLNLIQKTGGLMSDNSYIEVLVLIYEICIRSQCVLWLHAVGSVSLMWVYVPDIH
jgi:hypothetical protein